MQNSPTRRSLITSLSLGGCAVALSGCGLILYPERKGNTPEGHQIDPMIVVLDGLLCLLFLLPGVIAFAVDVSSGCIYMSDGAGAYKQVRMGRRRRRDIETQISETMGVPFSLDDPRLRFIAEPMTLDAGQVADLVFLEGLARPIERLQILTKNDGEIVGFSTV